MIEYFNAPLTPLRRPQLSGPRCPEANRKAVHRYRQLHDPVIYVAQAAPVLLLAYPVSGVGYYI